MKAIHQTAARNKPVTILAIGPSRGNRVLASGRTIQEVLVRTQTSLATKSPPVILFVPRKDAIHVF